MKILISRKDAIGSRVTFFVEVEESAQIPAVKAKIETLTRIPANLQVLFLKGPSGTRTRIEDEAVVGELGLAPNTVIELEAEAEEESKGRVVRELTGALKTSLTKDWLVRVMEECNAGNLPQMMAIVTEYEQTETLLDEEQELLSRAGPSGWTCLHIACLKGHAQIVEFLVEREISCNKETADYWTPLQLASYNGHVDCVEALLNHPRILVNKMTRGVASPLHLAASQGHPDVINLLVSKGGSLTLEDQVGRIPLEVSATQEVIELIPRIMGEMMLAKLANTDLPHNLASHRGQVTQTSSVMLNDRSVFLSVSIEDGNFRVYNSIDEFQADADPISKFSIIEIYDVYMAKPKAGKPGSETHFIVDSKTSVWRFYTASKAESEEWVTSIWEILKYCQVKKLGFEHEERSTFLAPPTPPSSYEEESKSAVVSPAEESLKQGSEQVSFSSFTILDQLGEGSFGKVFKVIKKNSNEVLAMKVLSKKFLNDNNQLKYAISECKIMRNIRHPFILSLHYAFQTPKNLFIVLEYCPNGDLMKHLSERNRFSEATATFYMAEVILALEYLHALDVVYRDLKPENILLDRAGHVRLADFGLAKENVNPLNPAMSFCGSPAYLAPELLTKRGSEKSADVYGLGAMLYEFLTGFPPFFSDNLKDLFKNIRKGNLQFTKSIKPEAQDLIRKLMNKDPSKRPTLSNVKKHPFFRGVDWEQVYLRRVTPPRLGPGWHQVDEGEQFIEPVKPSSAGNLLVDRDYSDTKAERVKDFNFSGR